MPYDPRAPRAKVPLWTWASAKRKSSLRLLMPSAEPSWMRHYWVQRIQSSAAASKRSGHLAERRSHRVVLLGRARAAIRSVLRWLVRIVKHISAHGLMSSPTSRQVKLGVHTLCGVEHKRDGVIGREVVNTAALIMFAEKS
jgi:hypothetical protein